MPVDILESKNMLRVVTCLAAMATALERSGKFPGLVKWAPEQMSSIHVQKGEILMKFSWDWLVVEEIDKVATQLEEDKSDKINDVDTNDVVWRHHLTSLTVPVITPNSREISHTRIFWEGSYTRNFRELSTPSTTWNPRPCPHSRHFNNRYGISPIYNLPLTRCSWAPVRWEGLGRGVHLYLHHQNNSRKWWSIYPL